MDALIRWGGLVLRLVVIVGSRWYVDSLTKGEGAKAKDKELPPTSEAKYQALNAVLDNSFLMWLEKQDKAGSRDAATLLKTIQLYKPKKIAEVPEWGYDGYREHIEYVTNNDVLPAPPKVKALVLELLVDQYAMYQRSDNYDKWVVGRLNSDYMEFRDLGY